MDNLLEERNTAVEKAATDVFKLISDSLGKDNTELTADASAQLTFNWEAGKLLLALRSRHRAINMVSAKEVIIKQLGRVKEDRVKVDETFSKLLPALSNKEPSSLRALQHKTIEDVWKLLADEEELLDLRLQGLVFGSENSANTSAVPDAAAPTPTSQPVAALKELEQSLITKMKEILADNQSRRYQHNWPGLQRGWATSMAAVPKDKKVL